MAFEFTDANFAEKTENGVAVVDFWAEWCGPCRMVGPHIEDLAKQYGEDAMIGKLNVDHNPEVSAKFGIRNIPTVLFLKNGEVVDRQVGAAPKKVYESKLQSALALV